MNLANLDHPLSSRQALEGRWVDIGPARFLIAPLNDRNRAFRVFGAKHGRIDQENMASLLAEAVVLDWEGLIVDREPLAFSTQIVADLLAMHPALADAIFEAANQIGEEDAQAFEEDAEQLKKSPGTKGNGAAKSVT